MPARYVGATRVLTWGRRTRSPYRPGQWLPRSPKWYWLDRQGHYLLVMWIPFKGVHLIADHVGDARGPVAYSVPYEVYSVAIKKRAPMTGTTAKIPAAEAVSTILGKLPALREFTSARQYEDGSNRNPGTFKVSTQGTLWEILLQDPDAAARLTVRDLSLDKALLLAETWLGAEDAPWETDQYLAQKLTQKKPKK